MSRRKHPRKDLKTENAFAKNMIFSLLVIIIILSLHLFLTEFIFERFDDKKDNKVSALAILDVQVNTDIISINDQKSPNLNVDVKTNHPANLIMKMTSSGFEQTINTNEFLDEHNLNLFLPQNLFGEEIILDMVLYDKYSRKTLYKESYVIPAIKKPMIAVN